MTPGEDFENKWFYMNYIGKYFDVERLLTRDCIHVCFILRSIKSNGAGALRFYPSYKFLLVYENIYDLLYKTRM